MIQELLKEVAQTHTLDSATLKDFKGDYSPGGVPACVCVSAPCM